MAMTPPAAKLPALDVIFTGICAIEQEAQGGSIEVVCPRALRPRPSVRVTSGPDAVIPAHHAFVRVPADSIDTAASKRPPDAEISYTGLGGATGTYAVFLVDGEALEIVARGTSDTSLALTNQVEMSNVCRDDLVERSNLDTPRRDKDSLRFSWGPVHLGSNVKRGESWQFDPPVEGGASSAGPLAQEIFFRLALDDATVRINSTDLEDDRIPLPPLVLNAGGAHLRVWIGHSTLNNILMKPPYHKQSYDTDFELYYDLISRARHTGPLHIPKNVTLPEDMHGSNCPPVIFRPRP